MDVLGYKYVADRGLLIEFATEISDAANEAVIALDHAIGEANIPGVVEVIPALVNLLVIFDPLQTRHIDVEEAVRKLKPEGRDVASEAKTHHVGVCYEDGLNPDLQAVSEACDMSPEAVIKAHTSATYRVCMYGFAPGYAYLSGVPKEIQVPRKPKPVRDVPAGSVMIAGPQGLVTTLKMPTGWSVIGRTAVRVMTGNPEKPFLFDVGDSVKFQRIDRETYESELP